MKLKVAGRGTQRVRARVRGPVTVRMKAPLARLVPRQPLAARIPADLKERLARMAPEFPVRERNLRLLEQLIASAPERPTPSRRSRR